MKTLRRSLFVFAATALLAASTCLAQDATTDAAAQAAQQAERAGEQSAQAAQQASQEATQDLQDFLQQTTPQQNSSSTTFPSTQPAIFPQQPTGPLPAQIASAHTILLTNAGISPRLSLDDNLLYSEIHNRLANWGYYHLVSTPDQADLIFEFSVVDPHTGLNGQAVPDAYGRSPLLLLVIADARTGTPLWTVNSPLYLIGKKQTAAHWLALSEDNFVSRIKVLANQSLSAGESAQLTTYPKNHNALIAGVVVGGFVGLAVAGGLILHLMSDNALAKMKADQDAFCEANHIPLSECAGG